jgi:hypothetical protein
MRQGRQAGIQGGAGIRANKVAEAATVTARLGQVVDRGWMLGRRPSRPVVWEKRLAKDGWSLLCSISRSHVSRARSSVGGYFSLTMLFNPILDMCHHLDQRS